MPTKPCKVCKEEQDTSKFPKNSKGKYGVGHMCLVCHAEYAANYRKHNYNKVYAMKYKTTESAISAILERRVCDVCGCEPKEDKRHGIDHCHTKGKVRGLLCDDCNIALGKFKDSIDLLKSAIKYLEESKDDQDNLCPYPTIPTI